MKIAKTKKRMICFIIKKKKNLDRVNFHPIQLNLPKKKGDKTRNYVTKQREMTTYIASPYILTICVQNP